MMTDQLDFATLKYGKPSIDDRFTAFHKAHPEVYELFRQYAEKALATGFERFSADMICHRIRWYHHIDKGDRDFTINDHYTSRYEAEPSPRLYREARGVVIGLRKEQANGEA